MIIKGNYFKSALQWRTGKGVQQAFVRVHTFNKMRTLIPFKSTYNCVAIFAHLVRMNPVSAEHHFVIPSWRSTNAHASSLSEGCWWYLTQISNDVCSTFENTFALPLATNTREMRWRQTRGKWDNRCSSPESKDTFHANAPINTTLIAFILIGRIRTKYMIVVEWLWKWQHTCHKRRFREFQAKIERGKRTNTSSHIWRRNHSQHQEPKKCTRVWETLVVAITSLLTSTHCQ